MARQDGLAHVRQLIDLGVPRGVIRRRIDSGEWERLWRGIVGPAGVAPSWRRNCRLALLAAAEGAVLAAATAARLHRFDGYDADQRIILAFRDDRRPRALPADAVGIRASALRRNQVLVVEGLAVVARPVALIQIAATDGDDATGKALDSMLRTGDAPSWIRHVAADWRRSGVVGPQTVLRLLDERVDGRLPRSWFQRLAKRVLRGRGLRLVDEYVVRDALGRRIAELDLADPVLMIGVECQSWRWHATPSARGADARRKRHLRVLGWDIVEVWWSDLDRMDEVLAEIQVLIDRRRPLLELG